MANLTKEINPLVTGKYTALFIYAGFIMLITGCGGSGVKVEEEIVAKTPVTVISPERKSMSETIEFPAVSTYLRKNIVRSSTTGKIETCDIVPGDPVKKSQVLFTVKTLEASALQEARQADTNLVFKGLIRIISPDDGLISSLSHQKSDFVQEGDELAVLSDQNSLVFNLEVPFEQRRFVELNKSCSLRLPDSTFIKGVISGRLPEMNSVSQTLSYIVKPAVAGHLPQNLIAAAIINKFTKPDVQVLPRAALLGNETQTEFWVMKALNDSTAVKVTVKKGIENYNEVEIVNPLFQPDDKILLTGNYGLPDTAAIIIQK